MTASARAAARIKRKVPTCTTGCPSGPLHPLGRSLELATYVFSRDERRPIPSRPPRLWFYIERSSIPPSIWIRQLHLGLAPIFETIDRPIAGPLTEPLRADLRLDILFQLTLLR